MKSSVTIAIPVFNGEKYIGEALDSIVSQTLKVDQITICDNCSTDNTLDIIKKFRKEHSDFNISIIENETNLGYQRNFNKCMELTETDYLILLAADDRLKKDIVKVEKEFLDKNKEYAIIGSYADRIDENGTLFMKHEKREDQFYHKGEILEFLQQNRLYLVPSAVLLRMDCIRETGYWDLFSGPDERYWPKLLKKYSIAIHGESLVERREHLDQTAVKDYASKYHDVIISLKENLTVASLESTPERRKKTRKLIQKQNSSSSLMMGNLVIRQRGKLWIGIKYWRFGISQYPALLYKTNFLLKVFRLMVYKTYVCLRSLFKTN